MKGHFSRKHRIHKPFNACNYFFHFVKSIKDLNRNDYHYHNYVVYYFPQQTLSRLIYLILIALFTSNTKLLKKTKLLFLLSSLIILSSCGQNTFLGTWSTILEQGHSSSPPSTVQSKYLDKSGLIDTPEQVQNINTIKIVGIPNRDRNLLFMNDSGGQSGYSVTTGDFNNDGLDDIVLGAPESDGILKKTTPSGWAYMIFGDKNFSRTIDLKRELDVSFWGGSGGGRNRFGHVLTSSDLNGDGLIDLIIGAPHQNGIKNKRVHSGAIYVVFGKKNFKQVNNLSQSADLIIFGAKEGDIAGFSLASGNLNGDDYMDLIIGAPGTRNQKTMKSKAGAVYLLFGRNKFPRVINLAQYHNGRLSGGDGAAKKLTFAGNLADQAGYSVLAEDVNLDGLDDILIGAPYSDGFLNKGEDVGEVFLVLGRKRFPGNLDLTRESDSTIFGSKNFEHSGKQLASGDIYGNGLADILISSPGTKIKTKSNVSNGIVFCVPGRSSWPKTIFLREKTNKAFLNHYSTYGNDYESSMSGKNILGFGSGIASLDLNGDKRDDLIAGVPGAPKGKAGFGAGSLDFFITNNKRRGSTASGFFQPTKISAKESLGKSIALGDINGDGNKDILIGAPGMIRNKQTGASGGAYVIFGPNLL
jgi:hypothetical protein